MSEDCSSPDVFEDTIDKWSDDDDAGGGGLSVDEGPPAKANTEEATRDEAEREEPVDTIWSDEELEGSITAPCITAPSLHHHCTIPGRWI